MLDTKRNRVKVTEELNRIRDDIVAKAGDIRGAIRIDLLDPSRKKRINGAYFWIGTFKDIHALLKDFDETFGQPSHKDCDCGFDDAMEEDCICEGAIDGKSTPTR